MVRRAWTRLRRGFLRSDGFALLALVALTLVIGLASVQVPQWVPPATVALVVLVGGFTLSPRSLVLLLAVVAGELAWLVGRVGINGVRYGNIAVVAVTAIIVVAVARSRARLGVQGLRGESMLVDLRDRLRAQGELPELPEGWSADVVLRPAGGASFSGDFLVAGRGADERLEIVLVDVSGKGVDAGTRALLLSGAFGGLLGATPSEEFLAASNAYLMRQGWDEGFRHGGARRDRPVDGRVPRRLGRAPAGGALHRRVRHLAARRRVRHRARRRRRGEVRGRARPARARRRAAALHRRAGRAAGPRHHRRASTGCSARRRSWCRRGSVAVPAACSTPCAPGRATTAPSS